MATRRNFLRSTALSVAAIAAAPVSAVSASKKANVNQVGDKLRIGIAREVITPKVGGLLWGYGSSNPSTAVNDDLTVTAIAFEYGSTKVVLMSVTILYIGGIYNGYGFGNAFSDKLRALCGEATGIPASNVIIAAIHTHSAPVISEDGDMEYRNDIFVPKCVEAAKAAVQEMKPVSMGIATTETKVGINRRRVLPDDRIVLSQNPWGPYDPEMTVIAFKDEQGKPFANIVHCTAHPTAAGTNTEISRDWPGVMIDRLEKQSGAMTMFFNGTLGDVAPRIPSGGSDGGRPGNIEYAMEVGSVAALDAICAYNKIRIYRAEELSVVTGEIKLPHAPIMPLEEAKEKLEKVESGRAGRFSDQDKYNYATVIELYKKGETGESFFEYGQTIVKIGPVVMVPIPFEASCEIGLRLRTYSKYGYTLSLGCTNGSNSYLATSDQVCLGGYEIDRFTTTGPRRLADNVDNHLINQNLQLIGKL